MVFEGLKKKEYEHLGYGYGNMLIFMSEYSMNFHLLGYDK